METISTRPKSPTRSEAIGKLFFKTRRVYDTGVLLGNWVEDRIECPKTGTLYFTPKEDIDYEAMKPESRQPDFRLNKLYGLQGNVQTVCRHDSHDSCPNYATTNDLVYNHLPKPLCGPIQRYYRRCKHQFYPQPDLMKCFGNVTEWGLRKYLQHEWACTDVSDYISSLYDDTYVAPLSHQYLQRCERHARNSCLPAYVFPNKYNLDVFKSRVYMYLPGNWVEDRIECPKTGTLYFTPKEDIDYEAMKPESRQPDFRLNKLYGLQGNVQTVCRHDSHDSCPNYATTNDLVYNHLPKPLCGPIQRYYRRCKHQFYPQPDLMKCFGNVTEWGLRKYLQHEWACTDVSDYISSLYDDTYVAPLSHQYLQRCERHARNSSFTKSFCFKMTKPKKKP